MNSEERSLLSQKLFSLLVNKPNKNKYELRELLLSDGINSFTTSDINSVLYGNPVIFQKDNQTLPIWNTYSTKLEDCTNKQGVPETAIDLAFYNGHHPRDWQTEALTTWVNIGRLGVVEAVTGTGKTAVGIMAAADAVARGLSVLILVPGIELLEQWFKKLTNDLPLLDIGKYGNGNKATFELYHIIVSTVQSAMRVRMLPEGAAGLVIADEVHRYGAKSYSLALEESFEERLGLTATYDRNDNKLDELLSPYFSPMGVERIPGSEVIHGCGYARGLNDGILAPFRVGLLGINFEPDELESYQDLDEAVRKKRRKLISDYNCPAEPFGEFMAFVQKLSEGGQGNVLASLTAQGYLSSFSKRRKLLAESKTKEQVLELLKFVFILANRCLVFTETKISAGNTANRIRHIGFEALDFSSDLNKKERKERMLAFEKGDIKILCSPKVLDEGIDMPEADLGIILAASKTKRQMIQRMGRIIRPKKDNRPATFFIIYFKNTSEDPDFGAHEAFLDEMTDHAVELHNFGENPGNLDIFEWYIEGFSNQTKEA
ncbi:MAG: DEAD/DEAH box helicase [Lentimicrobium sp.]